MKLSSAAAALALTSLAAASPVPSDEVQSVEKRAEPYVTVSGLKFDIAGSTKYFAGTNSYWISMLTNDADIDLTMSHVAASGLKVLRVWGFNDVNNENTNVWFQSFVPGQQPKINTGTNGLGRIDKVVAAAEKYGIKLIIPLVNNWSDYGGMPLWNTYYGTTKATWYTDAAVQTQYKKYIAAVVSRYVTSPAIFAWELANEPRCNGCNPSIIHDWAATISAYIKSLDGNHLVTLGDEGWLNGGGDATYPYTPTEGVDFAANLKIPTLDFGTFHLYPTDWSITESPGGENWFKAHGAICAAAGKPCIAEEYSSRNNKLTAMASWQAVSLCTPGIAGDMFWQWGETTLASGTTHDDGHAIYYQGGAVYNSLVTGHIASIDNPGCGPATSNPATSTIRPASSSTRPTTTTTRPPTVTSTIRPITTSTKAPTSTAVSGTVPHWGQCGGQGWTGGTVCESPWTCIANGIWYSQCL